MFLVMTDDCYSGTGYTMKLGIMQKSNEDHPNENDDKLIDLCAYNELRINIT